MPGVISENTYLHEREVIETQWRDIVAIFTFPKLAAFTGIIELRWQKST